MYIYIYVCVCVCVCVMLLWWIRIRGLLVHLPRVSDNFWPSKLCTPASSKLFCSGNSLWSWHDGKRVEYCCAVDSRLLTWQDAHLMKHEEIQCSLGHFTIQLSASFAHLFVALALCRFKGSFEKHVFETTSVVLPFHIHILWTILKILNAPPKKASEITFKVIN